MKHITKYELFESSSNGLIEEQIEFLDKYTIGTWKLNPTTGLVDIDGDFDCSSQNLMDFKEIKFGIVRGYFACSYNNLTSLEGAPQEVGSGFYSSNNQLTSLEGSPQEVEGYFYCSNNQLTSLEGAPQEVGGTFYCDNNKLTSLAGGPREVRKDFYCSGNKLTSLEGAPQEVGKGFHCSHNKLTSLEGAPQEVGGSFYCYINKLTSLEGSPQKIKKDFYCYNNNLTSLEGAPQEVGGHFSHDDFQTYKWSLEWQIENLEKYPILATIASPEVLQKFINENPTKATITLKKIWKDLMKNPKYKHLKFPTSHKEDIDLLSDLSDLGL